MRSKNELLHGDFSDHERLWYCVIHDAFEPFQTVVTHSHENAERHGYKAGACRRFLRKLKRLKAKSPRG